MGPTFNRRETLGLPLGAERESVGRRRERERARGKNRKVPACLPDCLPDCLSHHIVNSQDRPPPPRRVRSSDGLDRDRLFPEPCHRVARRRRRRLLLFHACRSTHKLSHLYSRERRVDWRVTWRRRRTRSSAEMQRHSPRQTALQNVASHKSTLRIRMEGRPSGPSPTATATATQVVTALDPY